MLALGGFP
jgi:hypothetical protein